MFSQESDILRRLRLIEWLKGELVTNTGLLFQAMAKNSEKAIIEGLAAVVLSSYILARRLGIEFSDLEAAVAAKIGENIKKEHEAERLYGDYSEYQRYLRHKR